MEVLNYYDNFFFILSTPTPLEVNWLTECVLDNLTGVAPVWLTTDNSETVMQ